MYNRARLFLFNCFPFVVEWSCGMVATYFAVFDLFLDVFRHEHSFLEAVMIENVEGSRVALTENLNP